jgi:hypothetical protein
MENLKKLSRADMKIVRGGKVAPECLNDCNNTGTGTCASGTTCQNVACPDDPNYYHNVCK